jgi:hypothetical protein
VGRKLTVSQLPTQPHRSSQRINFMRKDPWIGVFFDTWSLGIEASSVIAARIMKLTAGGEASNTEEARRMIAEKVEAGLTLQTLALTGGLGKTPQSAARKTLAHYRRRVRANRHRLRK